MESNKYNPNTGELLKQGQTVQIGNTGTFATEGKVGFSNISPTIQASSLDTPKDFNLPTKPIIPTDTFTIPDTSTLGVAKTEAEKKASEAQSEYEKTLKQIGLVKGSEADLITEKGGDIAEQDVTRYKNELIAEQTNLRRKQEEIRKTFGGTTAGLQNELGRIERDSLSKQADIAILGNAAAGRFNDALSYTERKIKSQLAPLEAELESKKYIRDNNQDFFSKVQLLKLDSLIKADESKLKEKENNKEKLQGLLSISFQNGAPKSVIESLLKLDVNDDNVVNKAIQTAGKYGTDYLSNEIKKSTLARNYADIAKINNDIKNSKVVINTAGLPNTTAGIATKLMATAGSDKQLDATERQQLNKSKSVISQLGVLQSNIAKQNKTGLIKGKTTNLLEKIGLNADVGIINAQLQAITPNLARGVYGEVGVLTDNDIKLYRTTLPRLDRPQDQNDAILALTLKTVAKSIENVLTTGANSGINVSGWTQDYLKLQDEIGVIEDRIGVSKNGVNDLVRTNPKLAEPIKEMYKQGLSDREILQALNSQ